MAKTNEKAIKTNKKGMDSKVSPVFLERFRLLLLGLLAILVFYPPYLRGLYFEAEQLPTEIFVFILYIAFLIFKYLKNDYKFIRTPLEYASLGFVIVYLISIISALGTRQAMGEWLKYCMYFTLFLMLSDLLNTYKSKLAILWVLIASALGVSIIGIDAVAGAKIGNALNSFFKNFGSSRDLFFGTFVGNRINSTFQYPNATAAYLMAIFFIAISLMMISKNTISKFIAGISSYIILITFMLTISRGALLVFPFVVVGFIVLQKMSNIIKSILYLAPAGIGMLLTVSKLTNYLTNFQGNELNIWKYVFIGIGITIIIQVLVSVIDHYLNKARENSKQFEKSLNIIVSATLVIAGIFVITGIIIVLSSKTSLLLSHTEGQADSNIIVRRSFELAPDKEYKLVYNVQAENKKEKPSAYNLTIASRDFAGIINEKDNIISNIDGKATNGVEQREVQFKVPQNSRTVSITFVNFYEGTNVEFKDAKIVSIDNSSKDKQIALKYKFLPESIYSRIDEMKETKSGIERTIFAKDGLKMFKAHLLTGGGGGSWQIQNFAYQSYLYWSTQAHNYPVQVAVEAGIIGILVLCALYLAILLIVIRVFLYRNNVDDKDSILSVGLLIAITALVVHSFMDFDLSLSAVYLVLWQLLAILNSYILNAEKLETGSKLNIITNKLVYGLKSLKIHPAFNIIAVSIILIIPIIFSAGSRYYVKAQTSSQNNQQDAAIIYLDKAIKSGDFNPLYKADYINTVVRQKSISQTDIDKTNKYAGEIEKDSENNVDLAAKLGSYYLAVGNIERGMHYFDRTIELRPFRAEEWQQKADACYQIVSYYKNNKDNKSASEYQDKILKIPEQAKEINKKNMIPFILTPTTMELIEKTRIQIKQQNDQLASKTIFCNINDIDIDANGIPDEWNDTNMNSINLKIDGDKLTAESFNGKQGILQSRKLVLKTGKTYVVNIELENFNDVSNIPITISGMTNQINLVRNGSTYTAEFSTEAGTSVEPRSIGVIVIGKYIIKDMRVVEK